MARLLKQIIKGETGQALPVVLVLLLLGGLLVAPSLSYASTSLNAGQIVEKKVSGLYAADAGVEYVLWQITNSIPPSEQLPENVNQMPVAIHTEPIGSYALYYGDLIVVGEHPQNFPDDLAVDGEMVLVDEDLQVYKYTITVTWQSERGEQHVIQLKEVGVRLPVGYSYQTGSAADLSFADNLSTEEPEDTLDGADAHMLNWTLGQPPPDVRRAEPIETQTFYVTGEGSQEGDYTWVQAKDPDIGQVGEVIGTFYRITARATRPDDVKPTAIVTADVIWDETEREIRIILWQINPQEE